MTNRCDSTYLTRCAVALLVFVGAVCVGCGSGVPQLSGTVTLDGSPMSTGQVVFKGDNLPTAYAEIQSNGTYVVKTGSSAGLPAGTYQVSVAAYETLPSTDPTQPPDRKLISPKKYESPKNSGLSFQVIPGSNTYDIELVSGE